jgi:replicative DNA helicase
MNLAHTVFAAVIPGRRDLLVEAMRWLTPDHFRVDTDRGLWVLLCNFYDQTGEVLTPASLGNMVRRSADTARALLFEEIYAKAYSDTVVDADFRYAYQELRRIRADQLTGEAFTTAMEILQRGVEVKGEVIEGYEAAWAHAMAEYARVNQIAAEDTAPEGNMMREVSDILADYGEREHARATGSGIGVLTGIHSIDQLTSGLQPGEMMLVCAYTGEGKSMLCAQTAWRAAVHQGKNVFFVTSETTRAMTRRRIVARHSLEPKFSYREGLNSNDLKNGTLTPAAKAKFIEVATDLNTNENYGQLYIAQVPRGATLATVEARLVRFAQQQPLDLVVIDYLALLKPDRRRDSAVTEFSDLLRDTKVLAATFDSGRGVPIISPWAMNRDRFTQAKKDGYYTLASLADTSEAEKSPDLLLSLLGSDEGASKVRAQFLKNRDGEVGTAFSLEANFRSTFIGEPAPPPTPEELYEQHLGVSA